MTKDFLDMVTGEFQMSPFWNFIGLELKELQEGQVKLYLPFNPAFKNVQDTLHGGVYASVLDTAMGMAGRTLGFIDIKTIQLDIQFLKPVLEGGIYSEAKIIHQKRSTILVEGQLFNEENDLIAHSTGTFKVSKN